MHLILLSGVSTKGQLKQWKTRQGKHSGQKDHHHNKAISPNKREGRTNFHIANQWTYNQRSQSLNTQLQNDEGCLSTPHLTLLTSINELCLVDGEVKYALFLIKKINGMEVHVQQHEGFRAQRFLEFVCCKVTDSHLQFAGSL